MHLFAVFLGLLSVLRAQVQSQTLMGFVIRDFKLHSMENISVEGAREYKTIICAGVVASQLDCSYIHHEISIEDLTREQKVEIPVSDSIIWPTNDWKLTLIISDCNRENKLEVSTEYNNITSISDEQYLYNKVFSFYFTLACVEDQYGPSCRTYCHEYDRNPFGGYAHCDKTTGEKICSKGWKGPLCDNPVCERECYNGRCIGPNVCNCSVGWKGPYCDECIPQKECQHGYCRTANDQCICSLHWGGQFCNIAIDLCSQKPDLCRNGGSCSIDFLNGNYYCNCVGYYVGKHCETFRTPSCEYLNCGPDEFCIESDPQSGCHHRINTDVGDVKTTVLDIIVLSCCSIWAVLVLYYCIKEYRKRKNNQQHSARDISLFSQNENQARHVSVSEETMV